jgi:hypothetical protein
MHIVLVLESIPEKGKFFWAMNVKNVPPLLCFFLKRGDDGEWARVTMVQGMHPIPSVILCESRESRKTIIKEYNPPTAVGWA